MNTLPRLSLLSASLLLATAANAQLTRGITYVDADPATNTTNFDGTPFTPVTTEAADGLWTERTTTAANNTVFQACGGSPEDCIMLRTTASGLLPGVAYDMYAYFWGVGHQRWRGRAALSPSGAPVPPIQGYNSNHFNGSSLLPMQGLATGTFLGDTQTSLDLAMDANMLELDSHFANTVKLTDGGGYLFEVSLGRQVADGNGEIHVYIDDVENNGFNDRTWYDGIGYEVAPMPIPGGCGSATIGMTGTPTRTLAWSIDLASSVPNSQTVLMIGFGAQPSPIDIGLFGLTPGCLLSVTTDLSLLLPTDAAGAASLGASLSTVFPAPVPLFWQYVVFDTSLNVAEMTAGLETWFHN